MSNIATDLLETSSCRATPPFLTSFAIQLVHTSIRTSLPLPTSSTFTNTIHKQGGYIQTRDHVHANSSSWGNLKLLFHQPSLRQYLCRASTQPCPCEPIRDINSNCQLRQLWHLSRFHFAQFGHHVHFWALRAITRSFRASTFVIATSPSMPLRQSPRFLNFNYENHESTTSRTRRTSSFWNDLKPQELRFRHLNSFEICLHFFSAVPAASSNFEFLS
jgi:hypothetical protein